ncbi:M20 family metallo-hydrolase [Oceanobacillus halotolerans]|uniref:M20 family metallo-hydrolase n=1 Tax=Oceanobacillus halotolerans TaxID=2663380 RepID=UPI0013D973AD|nr:M20 family metallo-hydrolase [Oceanobacillus halotolerans]
MSTLTTWLEETLCTLNLTKTMDVPNGFTRLSFTNEEKSAHHAFQRVARELGLSVYEDEVCNQWAVWEVDPSAPTIAIGSHLDTVDNGGGYDGVAGVLSALGAVKMLKDQNFQPTKNIAVVCFVSEESARFGVSTIGSKAISSKLNKEEIADVTDRDGITIKQAMEDFGVNWQTLDNVTLPVQKLESFLELHIEQSTQLVEQNADIGIINGVACPVRLKVHVKGMANHTGTTPMHNRQDAFVSIAPLVNFVQEEALKANETATSPLVATVSTMQLKPNAMNVIPGEIELGIDIRSVDDDLKRQFAKTIETFCKEIETKQDVTISITTLVDNDSVALDPIIQGKLQEACKTVGLSAHEMDSGAGHDVMNMASKWPSGLIFIRCKDGVSHHPDEYAAIEDIEKGTTVFATYLQQQTSKA